MLLSQKQIKYLKKLGHKLKPLVQVGKEGLSEALIKEVDTIFTSHELIKIKFSVEEKELFIQAAKDLQAQTGSSLVQTIGRTGLYYKKAALDLSGKERKRELISLPQD